MKIVLTLSALALSTLPALASGDCPSKAVKSETASSCAPGATWDAAKGACTLTPSS